MSSPLKPRFTVRVDNQFKLIYPVLSQIDSCKLAVENLNYVLHICTISSFRLRIRSRTKSSIFTECISV